jgi:hypothetical protein
MRQHRRRPWPPRHVRCEGAFAALALFFSGCYGDFGRPRPGTTRIERPAWVTEQAAQSLHEPASVYQLTDDERLLRELAYALIRPPYSRERWYVVLGQFVRVSAVPFYGENSDYEAYAHELLAAPTRSPAVRYAQLNGDIRSDLGRIEQFVPVAFRVADADAKREKALAYVSGLTPDEAANAVWRVRENAMVLAWVQHCLTQRAASFHYVLERLIIASPSADGVMIERLLGELDARIANLYPGLHVGPARRTVITK